jgi:3-hydroxyisobutyrate dehydrogenase
MSNKNIGWIGLGTMGTPMSQQLIKAGYPLTVYNRNKDKEEGLKQQGAKTAATPAELVSAVDIVIIMVTDDDAIHQIFSGDGGLLTAGATEKTIINMSTVSPAISKEMGGLCKQHGNQYIDAPVSGSVKQAETATLVVMAGGDAAVFEEVKPVLEKMAKMVLHIGDVGAGNTIKLAVNTLLSFHVQGLAEAVLLAKQNGIDAGVLLEVLNNGAMANPFMKIKGESIIKDDFPPAFSLMNIAKDLRLAHDIGLDTPMGKAALSTFDAAIPQFGDEDLMAVIKYLEK